MMTTLPACESAGVVGSIDGYWSRYTVGVYALLVTKKSVGRFSIASLRSSWFEDRRRRCQIACRNAWGLLVLSAFGFFVRRLLLQDQIQVQVELCCCCFLLLARILLCSAPACWLADDTLSSPLHPFQAAAPFILRLSQLAARIFLPFFPPAVSLKTVEHHPSCSGMTNSLPSPPYEAPTFRLADEASGPSSLAHGPLYPKTVGLDHGNHTAQPL